MNNANIVIVRLSSAKLGRIGICIPIRTVHAGTLPRAVYPYRDREQKPSRDSQIYIIFPTIYLFLPFGLPSNLRSPIKVWWKSISTYDYGQKARTHHIIMMHKRTTLFSISKGKGGWEHPCIHYNCASKTSFIVILSFNFQALYIYIYTNHTHYVLLITLQSVTVIAHWNDYINPAICAYFTYYYTFLNARTSRVAGQILIQNDREWKYQKISIMLWYWHEWDIINFPNILALYNECYIILPFYYPLQCLYYLWHKINRVTHDEFFISYDIYTNIVHILLRNFFI